MRLTMWMIAVLLGALAPRTPAMAQPVGAVQPQIVGDWWTIARDPDLGDLTLARQQPVDFGIWQAGDGTWQLWSCVRGTKEVGHTRLLYRWEGAKLTDRDWTPKGIAMRADPQYGEQPGGLQAPYVFRDGARFVMFYGSWEDICSASGTDGKEFTRLLNAQGKATLFGEGSGNTRDPMVLKIDGLWYCYYTAHVNNIGKDYCRTSADLRDWSPAHIVAEGGEAGTGPSSAECPFVVQLGPKAFYLFRTQRYGQNAQTRAYFSNDPLDFGRDDDKDHLVCTLPIAAPELFKVGDQWYIAALRPDLKGIQVSRLDWK